MSEKTSYYFSSNLPTNDYLPLVTNNQIDQKLRQRIRDELISESKPPIRAISIAIGEVNKNITQAEITRHINAIQTLQNKKEELRKRADYDKIQNRRKYTLYDYTKQLRIYNEKISIYNKKINHLRKRLTNQDYNNVSSRFEALEKKLINISQLIAQETINNSDPSDFIVDQLEEIKYELDELRKIYNMRLNGT